MHWKNMLTLLVLCSIGFTSMLVTAILGIAAHDTVKAVIGIAGTVFNGFFVGIYWLILALGKWKR